MKALKLFAIIFGSVFCIMHYVFTITEVGSWWWLVAIILLPLLAWPFIAWKWTKVGAWVAFAFGAILIGVAIADIINSGTTSARGIAGFLAVILLPFIISGGLLLYSAREKKEANK